MRLTWGELKRKIDNLVKDDECVDGIELQCPEEEDEIKVARYKGPGNIPVIDIYN